MQPGWVWLAAATMIGFVGWGLWPARLVGAVRITDHRRRVKFILCLFALRIVVDVWHLSARADFAAAPAARKPVYGEAGKAGEPGGIVWAVAVQVLGVRVFRRPLRGAAGGGSRVRPVERGRNPGLSRWMAVTSRAKGVLPILGRRVRIEELRGEAIVGTGDAATTGLGIGGAWALWGAVTGALLSAFTFTRAPIFEVTPVFQGRCLRWSVRGRVMIRQGWLAAALGIVARAAVRGLYGSMRPAAAAGWIRRA